MIKYSLCWLLVFIITSNTYAQPQSDTAVVRMFSHDELQQDMDSLYHWLNSSHPSLYFSISKEAADKKWKDARAKIPSAMSRTDFMKLVVPLTTQYRDGHTALYLDPWSDDIKNYERNGGKIFPAHVHIRDGRLWILHHSQGQLLPGDEVLSINGKPVKTIITTMLPYWPGDGLRNNEHVTSRFFGITLWYLYQWGNELSLEIRRNGRLQKMTIPGLRDATVQKERSALKPEWRLHIYEEEKLAVLESNSYNSTRAAAAFLDSAFTVIKQKGIQHVALDLRDNEGGNSSIGDMVLSYVTKKKFAPFAVKRILRNIPLARLEDNDWIRSMQDRAAKEWTADGAYYRHDLKPHLPDTLKKPELFFNGKFYLLTSGTTYSSAHMTAIEVNCFGLGLIIGEPTGERMNLSGEMMGMVLPNTKLPGACAGAAYETPCGDGKQVGVKPDILVPFSAKDMSEGKDTVIEYLKRALKP
jgi:C-terminal processing protease CtpA/Prc